ncbi:uncharacterized protein LOC131674143 [Phymastichus coffea]|uniref:uncharacterized protein LOC131674143 n=1 Tax=Phymastichus coffea TaxID=108790 RepID=UPI00273C59E8|nr:uncharacterized protein LOC131674143 [Phymastichus coffea]
MKFLVILGVIAVTYSPRVLADNRNMVKIVYAKPVIVNPEYFDEKTLRMDVIQGNETYNSLSLNFDILKDFPRDTEFVSQLYRSNARCRNYRKMNEYAITLCTNANDQYAQYLPNAFVTMKQARKCVTKGKFQDNDVDWFKFYNILSEEELKSSNCFRTINSFISRGNYIFSEDFIFVTN